MKNVVSLKNLIICLVEIIVGILLLLKPVRFTNAIIIVFGVLLLLYAISVIIKYFRTEVAEAAIGQYLVKGLFALLIGSFCIFRSEWFVATFPILTILYGLIMLAGGLWKIQLTADLIRMKKGRWYIAAVSAVVSVICAAVILGNPFTSTAALWIFTGVTLIAEAFIDIVTWIINGKDTVK